MVYHTTIVGESGMEGGDENKLFMFMMTGGECAHDPLWWRFFIVCIPRLQGRERGGCDLSR